MNDVRSKSNPGPRKTQPPEHKENNHSEQALIAVMEASIGVLRSIKDAEFRWLELYTLLAGPAVAFLAVRGKSTDLGDALLIGMLAGYFLATIWVQFVLWKERRSYYAVLRTVVRAQNFLGLFKIEFLSDRFANSAFPKGLGPLRLNCAQRNGTAPFSSFLQRHIYVLFVFVGLGLALVHNGLQSFWWVLGVLCDVFWVIALFLYDHSVLYREALEEKHLAGSDPTWFP